MYSPFIFSVPCVWENWSSSTWSNCSSACGGGSQNRTRTIKKKEGHNGTDCIEKVCSSKNVTENCGMQTQECNTNVLCPGNYLSAKNYPTRPPKLRIQIVF